MNLWLTAARPRTLPAALVPVLVAGAAARRDKVFDWFPFALTLIGALAIQIAANFANDASDAHRGADPPERIGPQRMVASGKISPGNMWKAVVLTVVVAATCGVILAQRVGPVILLIGAISILAMLTYVGGPFPYGYRGLGEVFVFLFFGLVATGGSRLAYDGQAPAFVWWLGPPIGLLAGAILMANNLRDLPTDRQAGKRTLAVLLGEKAAITLFFVTLWTPFAMTIVLVALGVEPMGVALGAVASVLTIPMLRLKRDSTDQKRFLPLLGGTVRTHLTFGALVAIGLLL